MERVIENTSAGGVLRDQGGNWILRYNSYLGKCSLFEAELWGVLDGILLLLNKGYRQATVQIDNAEVAMVLGDKEREEQVLQFLEGFKESFLLKEED